MVVKLVVVASYVCCQSWFCCLFDDGHRLPRRIFIFIETQTPVMMCMCGVWLLFDSFNFGCDELRI